MNITKYNFKKSLPLIFHTLRSSDYIAFDFEFTGISSNPDLVNNQTDSV